jgi:hypothetical protein
MTTFNSLVCLCLLSLAAQAQTRDSPYGKPDDLPPGIPHAVDTNGNVFSIDPMFTTAAFQEEGLRLVIAEANAVAKDLRLSEPLPITRSNLSGAFIAPFGYTYIRKRLGNVTTTNYSYNVGQDFKLSDVSVAKYDQQCLEYCREYRWPISRLDTNTPYRLAIQWLAAMHADVEGLNRDCDVHVSVSPYWNEVELGEVPKAKFTPIYCVWWRRAFGSGKSGAATVELFLPTKTLLQLTVSEPQYILRQPLVFTNLPALFPGKAEIITNRPGPVIEIQAPLAIISSQRQGEQAWTLNRHHRQVFQEGPP